MLQTYQFWYTVHANMYYSTFTTTKMVIIWVKIICLSYIHTLSPNRDPCMCVNFKCLSSQVGMDAGLFHPCFFAFLAISISILIFPNITFILFSVLFLNPFMDFDRKVL